MAYITVKEAANRLNASVRTIQRKCKESQLKKGKEGYLIPEEIFKKWLLHDKPSDTKRHDDTPNDDGLIQEWFTEEEHAYLDKLINTDHPVLLERAKQQEIRIEDHKETIRTLEDNLKLAQKRIDVLTGLLSDQTKERLQENTLKFIEKSDKN